MMTVAPAALIIGLTASVYADTTLATSASIGGIDCTNQSVGIGGGTAYFDTTTGILTLSGISYYGNHGIVINGGSATIDLVGTNTIYIYEGNAISTTTDNGDITFKDTEVHGGSLYVKSENGDAIHTATNGDVSVKMFNSGSTNSTIGMGQSGSTHYYNVVTPTTQMGTITAVSGITGGADTSSCDAVDCCDLTVESGTLNAYAVSPYEYITANGRTNNAVGNGVNADNDILVNGGVLNAKACAYAKADYIHTYKVDASATEQTSSPNYDSSFAGSAILSSHGDLNVTSGSVYADAQALANNYTYSETTYDTYDKVVTYSHSANVGNGIYLKDGTVSVSNVGAISASAKATNNQKTVDNTSEGYATSADSGVNAGHVVIDGSANPTSKDLQKSLTAIAAATSGDYSSTVRCGMEAEQANISGAAGSVFSAYAKGGSSASNAGHALFTAKALTISSKTLITAAAEDHFANVGSGIYDEGNLTFDSTGKTSTITATATTDSETNAADADYGIYCKGQLTTGAKDTLDVTTSYDGYGSVNEAIYTYGLSSAGTLNVSSTGNSSGQKIAMMETVNSDAAITGGTVTFKNLTENINADLYTGGLAIHNATVKNSGSESQYGYYGTNDSDLSLDGATVNFTNNDTAGIYSTGRLTSKNGSKITAESGNYALRSGNDMNLNATSVSAKSDGYAIFSEKTLTIENGTTIENALGLSYGMYSEGDMTIDSATLEIVKGVKHTGIYCNQNLAINNSQLAPSDDSQSNMISGNDNAICVTGTLTIKKSSLGADAAITSTDTSDSSNHSAILAKGNTTITGSTILADSYNGALVTSGTLDVSDSTLTSNNNSISSAYHSQGKMTITGSQTAVTISGYKYGLYSDDVMDLEDGDFSIDADHIAIYGGESLDVKNAKLTKIVGDTKGISFDKDISITDSKVNAKGIQGIATKKSLTITNGSVVANTVSGYSDSIAIYAYGDITIDGSATVIANESAIGVDGISDENGTIHVGKNATLIAKNEADSTDSAVLGKVIDSNYYHAANTTKETATSYITLPQYGVVVANSGYDMVYDKVNGTLQHDVVIQGSNLVKPDAVSTLAATQNGKTEITLNWKQVASTPSENGTATKNSYVIYRSTSESSNYSLIGTVADGTSYKDTGLDPNTTYYYYVCTTNGYFGTDAGIKSNTANAKTEAVSTTSIAKLTNTNHARVTVYLNASSTASGYKIYRSTTENGTYSEVAALTNGATTWTLKDPNTYAIGSTYYYKVSVLETLNNKTYEGALSGVKSIRVIPCTPNLKITKNNKKRKITLKWSNYSCVTKWQIKVNGKIVKTIKKKKNPSYVFKGKKKKTYQIQMRSYQTVNGVKVYSKWTSTQSVKF